MAINTREDLIDYCFHQLGAPVIQIELDEKQVEYCVDNAIDRWQNVHGDGSVRRYIPHTITQTDIEQGYIVVPDKIISVIKIIPLNSGMTTNLSGMGMFNPIYQYRLNDFWDMSRGGLSVYNDVMTNLQMVQDMLQAEIGIAFNRYSGRLYLEVDFKHDRGYMQPGAIFVVECYTLVDDREAPKMYNDFWLKKYTTALLKKQWGNNVKKYNGVALPGGITLNGQTIYDEAVAEIAQLEQELKDEWELPPIFMVG